MLFRGYKVTAHDRERFFSKVVEGPEGCWVWLAGRKNGYGIFSLGGRQVLAHRASLSFHLGRKLDEGLMVLHSCNNPSCVNPLHLREGSPEENSKDMVRSGRHHNGYGPRPYGEDSVFTAKEVEEVTRKYVKDGMSFQSIADEYGVSHTAVRKAVLRINYAHVPISNADRTEIKKRLKGNKKKKSRTYKGSATESAYRFLQENYNLDYVPSARELVREMEKNNKRVAPSSAQRAISIFTEK